MPNPPPRTPAECFATIILWLARAVAAHGLARKIPGPTLVLVWRRVTRIGLRFARLAERIRAGRYVPRRSAAAAPRPPPTRKPRSPNPLPQGFGWAVRLVQETAVYGSQLQHLFRDPEMAALIEAAPGPMGRTLRPLCRMLGVPPPELLAPPPRPRRAPADPVPRPRRQRPPPPPEPRWEHDPRPRNRLGFYKGPPPMLPIGDPTGPPPKVLR